MNLLHRLKYLLKYRRLERDLAEEIETHRQLIEQRLRNDGVSAPHASSASRRLMGNTRLAREDARSLLITPWLEGLWQDVAYAFRVLRRAPGFASSMIAVMALGIGATTGVFGLVDGLVLRKLPVHDPDGLVYFSQPSFSYPVYSEVQAQGTQVFSSVSAWDIDTAYVGWHTELELTDVLMASGNFYSTLGISAVLGRTFGPDDDRTGGGRQGLVAVISHAAWQRRFNGDPSVVGRALRVDQNVLTIIGVTPAGFFGVAPGLAPEITLPLTSTSSPDRLRSTSSSWVHMLGRLRGDVSIGAANTVLRTVWPAVLEATAPAGMPNERRTVYLSRSTSLHAGSAGFSRVRNQFEEPLWMLLALVGLLLTVACASAANLLLARGVSRHRELAVRLAIGAGRGRLIRQMMTESLVWTTLASACGLVLAMWAAGTLVSLMTTSEERIVVDLSINWRILGFTISLALLTAVACSIIPALTATRVDPGTGLKDAGQAETLAFRRWSAGKSLVAAQVAVTVLLLFGASLFLRSLARVLLEDAGFDRQAIVVLATDPEAVDYDDDRRRAFYQQLHERLRAIPGVQSASLSMYPPISGNEGAWTQSIAVDGNDVPEPPGRSSVFFNSVSPGFFSTIGMRLVRGRDFTGQDSASSPPVAIINETLARRYFPDRDPVGRHLVMGRNQSRRTLEVVGVVRDAKYQHLEEDPRSIAYLPHVQTRVENLFAELRTSGPLAPVVEHIRRAVRALDPVVPLRIETVADRIRESLVTERVIAAIAAALGLAALILACTGLFGMLAYAVSRRTKEIGLRLALGADRSTVLAMVIRQSLALGGLGIAIGLAGSVALGQFAQNLLFRVSPRDPLSLGLAAAIMLAVAVVAGYVPARRASRVDPVVALRCE